MLVSINCTAYNQEAYIGRCLDGFVMQKTNFPFEAIVHDDASTDGTANIIREYAEKYPNIIKPILETENQWSKGNLDQIMLNACQGKYIAFCEGDDYWIDPNKLQKQVDALENNPKATLCYTNFSYVNQYGQEIESSFMDSLKARSHSGNLFKELLREHFVMTATTLFRREIFDSSIYKNVPSTIDYANTLTAAALGEINYIPEVTACYRANPNGEMSTNNLRVQKSFDSIQEYFSLLFLDGKIQKPSKRYEDEIKQIICDITYYRAFHHGVKDNRYSFLINVCKRDILFLFKFINKGASQMLKKIF